MQEQNALTMYSKTEEKEKNRDGTKINVDIDEVSQPAIFHSFNNDNEQCQNLSDYDGCWY